MLWLIPIALALVPVFALASKAKAKDGTTHVDPNLPPPTTNGSLELVRQYAIFVGAPKPWQDFFVLVAQRESKGHADVGAGKRDGAPSWAKIYTETGTPKVAASAYEANKDMFAGCPWPRAGYVFGTGGFFAMFPAYGLEAFRGSVLACLHPWVVFDPLISMIMAVHFAQRLTKWPTYQGTVLSLRAGWGNPSKMGDASYLSSRRAKYRADAVKAGIDPSFVDSDLPPWTPLSGPALFEALNANRGWLPP